MIIIQTIVTIFKDRVEKYDAANNNNSMTYSSIFKDDKKKTSLKTRYLIAYVLTRSAMWAKAPYLYTLFMTVHKFSMAEIGILYLVDAVAALIFGPITGQLADIHGRKFFCHLYNFSIILNLLLRMQGSRLMAYLAQIVTGFGAGLICTTFEAWVVAQADIEFKELKSFELDPEEEKSKYLKKIFKKANVYDAIVSILTSIICAIIYSLFGIYAPFWISIFLSLIASIAVGILWDENSPLKGKNVKTAEQYKEAIQEFRKPDVLCIGLIDGIANAVLSIYLFSWTPILKQSTPGGMNVGFIFTCMVLTMIIGTKTYEVLIVYIRLNHYVSISGVLFVQFFLLLLIYFTNSFLARVIFFSLLNGSTGFYNPLNSIIKSVILIEKHRALLMNIFRIPLNIYIIVTLLTLRFMNPFTVALIAASMCFLAFAIGVYLCFVTPSLKSEEPKPVLIDNEIINKSNSKISPEQKEFHED